MNEVLYLSRVFFITCDTYYQRRRLQNLFYRLKKKELCNYLKVFKYSKKKLNLHNFDNFY